MADLTINLQDFDGKVRLFPLPNLVFFPHVLQPLHIFEQRYRNLIGDAIEGNRLIGISLLKPGWESDYEGCPPIHDVACLGHIATEKKMDDGKYNIILRGLCRIRIDKEVPTDDLYRTVRAQLLPDTSAENVPKLTEMLLNHVTAWLPPQKEIQDHFVELFEKKPPMGALCDAVSFALPIPLEDKQALLEELDSDKRIRRLIHILRSNQPPVQVRNDRPRAYPPEFSVN